MNVAEYYHEDDEEMIFKVYGEMMHKYITAIFGKHVPRAFEGQYKQKDLSPEILEKLGKSTIRKFVEGDTVYKAELPKEVREIFAISLKKAFRETCRDIFGEIWI